MYNSIVICQDKIIVVDDDDNKVKIHLLHDGKFLDKLDSDSSPIAICLMDATTICVLHDDGLIEMASIKSENVSPVFTRTKSFHLHSLDDRVFDGDSVFDDYRNVIRVNDNIVVVGVKKSMMHWCIASPEDGHVDAIHQICKRSIRSSVTTKDNIIYISCYAGDHDTGVYGFDILNPSECKYEYKLKRLDKPRSIKHQSLHSPRSIVINEDGNIFVGNGLCDYVGFFHNSCIHQLTASCQFVAIFTEGIPRSLYAMLWDHGRLYVTCYGSHDIIVFRHEYQDQNPEKDISFIECIKESSFRNIGLLLKNRMFPSKSTILHAIKEHGYNRGIQCLLGGMSNLLRKQIPDAIQVWIGYRTEDLQHTPLFVVMFRKKTIIPEKMKLLEPYDDYEIVFRNEHIPNDEEERISERSEVNANTTDKEDIARVLDCIANNTERLMNEHSNLSIIAASTVKSIGFNGCLSKGKLKESLCIVLYVPVKGIIPVGEKEFPKDIDGISTDVREGEFVFHGPTKADEWHQNLRMGCRISRKDKVFGTLGGFVDLPDGKTGCITAAHVVLNEKQKENYVKFKETKEVIEIYQPTDNSAAFGKVVKIVFEKGHENESTVDAALIEITDHDRTPNTGLFPSGNYPVIGFTTENPMMFNSGKTHGNSNISEGSGVVKYGCSTNITHGKLNKTRISVKMLNNRGKSRNTQKAAGTKFFNQIIVESSETNINFSKEGDSGALVFMYHTNNRDLEAIGLLIGGTTHENCGRKYIVTPIQDVFQQLGLENVMFKRFPDTK